jgi:hypothetical protein
LRDFWKVLQTKLFFYNLHFSFQSQHLLHPLTFSTKLLYAQTWRFVSQKKHKKKVNVSFSKAIQKELKKGSPQQTMKNKSIFSLPKNTIN